MSRTLGAVRSGQRDLPEVTTTFGVSGYLTQSDVLLYDRDGQSLWSQIDGRAVAGPRAGQRLEFLPAADMNWKRWKSLYPESRVLRGPLGAEDYDSPYGAYHATDRLLFPVERHSGDLPTKAEVFGVRVGADTACWSLEGLRSRAARRSQETRKEPLGWSVRIGGRRVDLTFDPEGDGVSASTPLETEGSTSRTLPVLRMYWFAWYTFHPRTEVDRFEDEGR